MLAIRPLEVPQSSVPSERGPIQMPVILSSALKDKWGAASRGLSSVYSLGLPCNLLRRVAGVSNTAQAPAVTSLTGPGLGTQLALRNMC